MHVLRRSAFVAATATALASAPRLVRAQTAEKIRLTGVTTDDLTPVFYALKNGLYAKAGLDVEFIPAASGTAATTAIISGTYEIAKSSSIASLAAHLRGLPLLIIGNGALWDIKNPFTSIVVATDSGIKNGADLNGKIASAGALNDLVGVTLSAWVDKNGGDSKLVKWVEVPNSAAGPAIAEHRIDVTLLTEPMLSAAVESGRLRILAPGADAIGEHYPLTIYAAHTDWLAKHGDAAKRFMRVTYDAATYTNGHHPETIAMMSDLTKIPLDVFRKMTRVAHATTSDPALLQPVIDMAAKYKNIPRGFPAKEIYYAS